MQVAGDDVKVMPQQQRVLLFCLCEVDVRLPTEEPWATAVKKKTKQTKQKTAQCSKNVCCRFSEM